jgi:hypothetical protein
MKGTLDCIPCFIRQALEAARMASENPSVHEAVFRQVLTLTAGVDLREPPPVISWRIHHLIRQLSGNPDPYKAVKHHYNQLALQWLPRLRELVQTSEDPFGAAVRLAIAGNIIDFGVNGALQMQTVQETIERALHQPLDGRMLRHLRQAIAAARAILYLGDNAGEIVFDRLLLEQMPLEKVTFAVKGSPILNDATRDDADEAGLTEIVRVIDTGSNAPGTVLEDCSPEFRRLFQQADVIIAKGQGNFETLDETPANLFFLFQVKCPVVAAHLGEALGTFVLKQAEMSACSVKQKR